MKKYLLHFILPFLSSCSGEKPKPYQIIKESILENHAEYRVGIADSLNKEDLVRIAYDLKQGLIWDKNFVCLFYLNGGDSYSGVWATVSYLPKCKECANSKDPSGEGVEYLFFGNK